MTIKLVLIFFMVVNVFACVWFALHRLQGGEVDHPTVTTWGTAGTLCAY